MDAAPHAHLALLPGRTITHPLAWEYSEEIGGVVGIPKLRGWSPGDRCQGRWWLNPEGQCGWGVGDSVMPLYASQLAEVVDGLVQGWVAAPRRGAVGPGIPRAGPLD